MVKDIGALNDYVWVKLENTGRLKVKMIGTIQATSTESRRTDLYFVGQSSRKLLKGIKEITRSDKTPKHLTKKQKKARGIAGAALIQEIKRASDPRDPVMPRQFWDEDFVVAKDLKVKDLNKEDVNAQRLSILLETFMLNPDGLARQMEGMGFNNVDDSDKAYDVFFKRGNRKRSELVRQGSDIAGKLRIYHNRIVAAYEMLPPEEQKTMNTAYDNFKEAWFQFRMKLNILENADNSSRNSTNKENAMTFISAMEKLYDTSEALASIAEKRIRLKMTALIDATGQPGSVAETSKKEKSAQLHKKTPPASTSPSSWDSWDAPSPKAKTLK